VPITRQEDILVLTLTPSFFATKQVTAPSLLQFTFAAATPMI
jgi:hypothetical protein